MADLLDLDLDASLLDKPIILGLDASKLDKPDDLDALGIEKVSDAKEDPEPPFVIEILDQTLDAADDEESVEEVNEQDGTFQPSSKRARTSNAGSEVLSGAKSLRKAKEVEQEAKRQEFSQVQEESLCEYLFRNFIPLVDTNQIQRMAKDLKRKNPSDCDFLETYLAELDKVIVFLFCLLKVFILIVIYTLDTLTDSITRKPINDSSIRSNARNRQLQSFICVSHFKQN